MKLKVRSRNLLSIFVILSILFGLSSCGNAQTRTLFADKAPSASLGSLPCPDGAEFDPDTETISCFNDDENLEDWLVKKYTDEDGVRYMLCNNPTYEVSGEDSALVGIDWFLWWIPVSEGVMKSVQEQVGGEILKVSDYCAEK
jgi:hypothetical protein